MFLLLVVMLDGLCFAVCDACFPFTPQPLRHRVQPLCSCTLLMATYLVALCRTEVLSHDLSWPRERTRLRQDADVFLPAVDEHSIFHFNARDFSAQLNEIVSDGGTVTNVDCGFFLPPQVVPCILILLKFFIYQLMHKRIALKRTLPFTLQQRGPGSGVGIATRYGLDGPGIESRWGRDFPHLPRPALGPTQPPVQWVPGLSRG